MKDAITWFVKIAILNGVGYVKVHVVASILRPSIHLAALVNNEVIILGLLYGEEEVECWKRFLSLLILLRYPILYLLVYPVAFIIGLVFYIVVTCIVLALIVLPLPAIVFSIKPNKCY